MELEETMGGSHAKGRLTGGQKGLAVVIGLLALADTPVFFIVMFVTVNQLVAPYFGGWGWTVPVATEITFAVLFLTAVLFEWLRRPSRALWLAPYPFAGISAFLNVWAEHGSVPGMAGHLAVTLAFFTPVTFAKTGVRKLMTSDAERARAIALADARAHARDMLRSALGVLWRWRTPVLLRRQLRSGRLPALVMAAVETGRAAEWEPAVEGWIAAAVTLPERVAQALAAARAEASAPLSQPRAEALPEGAAAPLEPLQGAPSQDRQEGPAGPPGARYGGPASGPREAPAEAPSEVPPAGLPGPARGPRKAARINPGRASDDDLAGLLVPRLARGEDVSATRAIKIIGEAGGGKSIGHERAVKVLALARAQASRVVPFGERRQA